jgi:prolipoprotein diacylglyceryltransferase
MVLCMLGYAVHRFINESLRIEPTVGLGLTLSQWGSVVIFVAAVGIEAYLCWATPSRRTSPAGAPAVPSPAPPASQQLPTTTGMKP